MEPLWCPPLLLYSLTPWVWLYGHHILVFLEPQVIWRRRWSWGEHAVAQTNETEWIIHSFTVRFTPYGKITQRGRRTHSHPQLITYSSCVICSRFTRRFTTTLCVFPGLTCLDAGAEGCDHTFMSEELGTETCFIEGDSKTMGWDHMMTPNRETSFTGYDHSSTWISS